MAGEEVFVASAINTFGTLMVFLTLFLVAKFKDKSSFWSHIWLAAIFLMLTYTFAVDNWAFNAVGAYDLRDAVAGHIEVFAWLSYLMITMVVLSLIYSLFRKMAEFVTRKKDALPPEEVYYGKI